MPVATPSEIQILLRISTDYSFISDMIPIVDSTIETYFNTDFDGSYPVSLKRPAAILIKQMIDNPGALIKQQLGDDEQTFGKIDLSAIFDGLGDLIVGSTGSAHVLNLKTINTNLGL